MSKRSCTFKQPCLQSCAMVFLITCLNVIKGLYVKQRGLNWDGPINAPGLIHL